MRINCESVQSFLPSHVTNIFFSHRLLYASNHLYLRWHVLPANLSLQVVQLVVSEQASQFAMQPAKGEKPQKILKIQ